jgi:hypothetical protein
MKIMHGKSEKSINMFGGKFEAIRTLGKPRRKWNDNIKGP